MDTIKRPSEGLRELALFAGAGGGILGGQLLGWRTVCAVEYEPHARAVLCARQNDGCLDPFPIWDDVRTFDGAAWRGRVDVVSGGFPCQDISCAGKGAGIAGERSGLWGEMARIIGEVRPRYALIENSPMLTLRGLDRVLCDLAALGYDARWGVVSAENAGAPHKRERIWIVADAREDGRICSGLVQNVNTEEGKGRKETVRSHHRKRVEILPKDRPIPVQWLSEPKTDGMADGVAYQLDRLERIGNGQCPQAMALAWRLLQ